jgi:regulatory protein
VEPPLEPASELESERREEALAVATRALARREHTQRSLRERLLRAGVSAGQADAVVEELLQCSLLDEGRFARERARVLAERGKGDAAIRFELADAGIEAP